MTSVCRSIAPRISVRRYSIALVDCNCANLALNPLLLLFSAYVFEIAPTGEDPRLKRLGILRLSSMGIVLTFGLQIDGGRLLTVMDDHNFMLWDYAADRYIMWNVRNLGDSPEVRTTALSAPAGAQENPMQ